MEIKPRRRGRPRKSENFEMVTGSVNKQESTLSQEAYLELQQKLECLESEKKALQKVVEQNDMKDRKLDSATLQRINVASLEDVDKLEKKIEQCKRELSGTRETMAGGDIASGLTVENRYDKLEDKVAIKIKMLKAQKLLNASKPVDLSDKDKDTLKQRKQELDSTLTDRKSTIGDEWNTKDRYEFARTVQRLSKYNEECARLENELKNINKLLNPNDPMAANLGYLNKKRNRNVY